MNEKLRKNFLKFSIACAMVFVFALIISIFQLNPAIDTGREFFIPYRMLNGEVLYKDIFNIYGPLAYQINAIAYLIFGTNVFSLRIFGALSATITMVACYFLSDTIFSQYKKHFLLLPFIIGILSLGTFNYVVPYAFAMTYGLSAFLVSLFFLILFSKNEKSYFAYLSCLFAGGAIACKYEFFAYLIFLLIYIFVLKKTNPKEKFLSLISLICIPLLSFGSLFLQGMSVSDLAKTSDILKTMAQTGAIKHLYGNFTGTYFNLNVFSYCFFKTLLLIGVSSFGYLALKFYKNDKFLLIITFLFIICGVLYVGVSGYSLFAIINAILFFTFIKKIYQNKPVFIFMISTVFLSLKTFFAVNLDVYGTYTLPFLILSILTFIFKIDFTEKEEIKKWAKVTITIVIIGLFTLSLLKTLNILRLKSQPQNFVICEKINSSAGFLELFKKNIYTYPYIAKPINEVAEYINSETKPTDKVVVLPETQFLNFITKRSADNLYDSLTPMYFETFGEKNIIAHFNQLRPEYFILNNRDTSDYGKKYICDDYGSDFCSYVAKNYQKVRTYGEKNYILQIFKRKDLL